MGESYRGSVQCTFRKYGVEGVIVEYPDGEYWHDFGERDGGCTFTVREPPLWKLNMIRRTLDNHLQGILPSPHDGTIYDLTTLDVEAHFGDLDINERAWLDGLVMGGGFQHVPPSGKKKKKKKVAPVAAPPKKPDCVPGSLAKGLACAGDTEAATIVAAHSDAIIAAEGRKGDRLKYAAEDVAKPLCHYYTRKIKVKCALAVDPAYVSLLQLKSSDGTARAHAVTVFNGRLLDSAEPEPLLLTRENLSHCLGAEYGGIVRGYAFVPQPVAAGRMKRTCEEQVDAENTCPNSPHKRQKPREPALLA